MPDIYLPTGDQGQVDQMMLDALKAAGIDVSQPLPVDVRLGFPLLPAARGAAADLLRAGYPSVRIETKAPPGLEDDPFASIPTTVATVQLVATPDSLRWLRDGLSPFAAARGGSMTGTVVAPVLGEPKPPPWEADPSGDSTADQADQDILDTVFAWDLDKNAAMTFTAGLGFESEQAARETAAVLINAGYQEVHLAQAPLGWVAEAAVSMTPKLKAIRSLRINLTTFAQSRGGIWLGFRIVAPPPRIMDDRVL